MCRHIFKSDQGQYAGNNYGTDFLYYLYSLEDEHLINPPRTLFHKHSALHYLWITYWISQTNILKYYINFSCEYKSNSVIETWDDYLQNILLIKRKETSIC